MQLNETIFAIISVSDQLFASGGDWGDGRNGGASGVGLLVTVGA